MDRTLLRLTGSDRQDFLQNLVTNDVTQDGLIYAALLTPQGKYLADFFVLSADDHTLIDVAADLGPPLAQRLSMYKLRADVTIEEDPRHLHIGLGVPPTDGHADPRHAALGWRAYRDTPQSDAPEPETLGALHVEHAIPQSGVELTPDSYILEMGFERLGGVDFRKGCYVGQEVTARMKHKTELRKGLANIRVDGPAEPGTNITAGDKVVGHITSRAGDEALAYLRFDRAQGPLTAGDAKVTLHPR